MKKIFVSAKIKHCEVIDLNIKTKKRDLVTQFLHYSMAVIGGFLGCYAVLLRADFLGNAQTANLVYLVMALLGRDFLEVLVRIGGVALYMLGAMLFVYLKHKTSVNLKYISLAIDLLCIAILSVIPKDADPIIALYPIFFAMSFQWNTFTGAYGYASSPIFSTNNVRQISLSLAEYLISKEHKHMHKMLFFLGTVVFFHIGVAISYVCVLKFEIEAVWFALMPLIVALILTRKEEKMSEPIAIKAGNASRFNAKAV